MHAERPPERDAILRIRQAFGANWTTITASGCLLLVLLLAVQHIKLRGELGGCAFYRTSLEQTVRFNIGLAGLVGRPIYEVLGDDLSSRAEEAKAANGQIVVVYNTMVCQKCLKDGLGTLREYRGRLEERGLGVLAAIGSSGEATQQYTLGLRQAGLLPFPFRYLENRQLEEGLPMQIDERYIETPLFFHVGADGRIRMAFKPDRWRMQDVDAWLDGVLAALRSQRELALARP